MVSMNQKSSVAQTPKSVRLVLTSDIIARRLMREMDEAYDASLPDRVEKLLHLMATEPKVFLSQFERSPKDITFAETPILHLFPACQTAKQLLVHFDKNKPAATAIAQVFKERRNVHITELSMEQDWFKDLEDELVKQGEATSPLFAAQVRLFISRDLRPR
jgi:hypothetical protein